MKKNILLFLSLYLIVNTMHAQNFLGAYTDQNSGSNTGFTNRIATDAFNNVINSTTFSGSVVVGGQNFPANGYGSMLIKRDDNGALLWAKSFTSGGLALIGGIYTDQQSNIYVTGMFGDTTISTTLNTQPFPIANGPGLRAFVAKLAPNGNVLWTNSIQAGTSGGSLNADLTRIAGNGTDRIVISCGFRYVAPQTVGSSVIDPADGNIMLATIDDNGNWIDGRVLTGSTNTHISISLAMNANSEWFVSGVFRGIMDFGPAGVLTSPPSDLQDFVAKCDASGNWEWALMLNSSSWWKTQVIAYQNDVFLLGSFGGSITMGSTTLTCPFYSTYVTRIDNAGNFLWAKKYGDQETNFYAGTLVNSSLYLTGKTTEALTSNVFDGYNLVYSNTLPATPPGQPNVSYIIKTDINGNVLSGGCYGFNFSTLNTTEVAGSNAKVYLTGNVGSVAKFGGHTIIAQQTNGSNYIATYTDSANMITGTSFYDVNSNGVYDAGEVNCPVNLSISGSTTGNALINGDYVIGVGTGTYTTLVTNPPTYYTISPLGYTSTFATLASQVDSNKNFAFQPIPGQVDLVIDLVSGPFRPGFNNNAYVTLHNIGTTVESGVMDISLANTDVTILSVMPVAGTITNNTISIPYTLNPGEEVMYLLHYSTSVTAMIGTPIQSTAAALNGLDLTPANNTITLNGFITGSYDPNDKVVFPAGGVLPSFITNGEKLDYTINFQNTGNDTAFTVLLIDTMSSNLDLSTFQILSSSHPMVVNAYGNVIWFRFNNILLPDSNTNEMMSHGFVKYRIQPKSSLVLGDEIDNMAYIYFDFNAPIITNTTNTIVAIPTSLSTNEEAIKIKVLPNPVEGGMLIIQSESMIRSIEIMEITGKTISRTNVNQRTNYNVNVDDLRSGVYLLQVKTEAGNHIERLIKK
jgi:uncharacterized repeat protein (TIGR01451 family)